jgi:hypothetical protein
MLMHVSPGEVRGLQALAMQNGTNLTINPTTGLPEAFKLKQLLPTLIGAGLSFIPGVGPLMAAGLVGGFETLRSGDLGKGLMAGLGAYGGANIGSALTSMGSKAAMASALPAGGSTALPSAAAQSAGESLLAQSLSAPQMSMVPGAASSTGSAILQAGGSAPMSAASVAALENAAAQQFAQQGIGSQLAQGAQAAFADPGTFGSTLYSQMGTKGTMAALAPPAVSLAESMQPKYDFPTTPEEKSNYAGPYYPTARDVLYPDEDRRSSSEFSYFTPSNPVPGFQPYRAAEGGEVPQLEDGGFVLTKKAVDGLGKGDNKRGQKVAAKGLGALPIKGKGHGTSDSIKTSIDGKVPALVSNGESYVPKRNVQKAGGAKNLYALMRKAERKAA